MPLHRSARKIVFLLFVALLLASYVSAQITNVTADQAPPKPGVGHDYIGLLNETVNPVIGSVSIKISAPTPAGREIRLPFAFSYDSNSANHLLGPSLGWTDNLGYLARGGWTYLVPRITDQTHGLTWKPINSNFPYTCIFHNSFVLTDLQGYTHALGMAAFQANNSGNCQWPGNSTPAEVLGGGDPYFQSVGTTHSAFPVTTSDLDGTVYYFSGQKVSNYGTGEEYMPDWIETRNGNKIVYTGTSGAFTFTDSAGRSVISVNGFGASGNTVAVAGLANPYTVTWGTANFNTSYAGTASNQPPLTYGCGSGASPPRSQPEITAIALPNGQLYQFQYDSATGLIRKI